jgi:serine/threonine protein kinase
MARYTLAGYELTDEELGHGHFGTVQLVRRIEDGTLYAMKKVDLLVLDPGAAIEISAEAKLLKSLRHSNIVSFVEAVKHVTIKRETLYLITEYCEGGDLEHYLSAQSRAERKLPESLIVGWLRQLCLALQVSALHSRTRSAVSLMPASTT